LILSNLFCKPRRIQMRFCTRAVALLCAASASAQINFRPEKTAPEIARDAFPSVALLTMQDAKRQPLKLGSAFFVAEDTVATNFHVIDGAAAGYAKIVGQPAKLVIMGIVALDPIHDLALLQVAHSPAPPLPIAGKVSVSVGDAVYAIGNPIGLEGTFSQGVVSGIRELGSDHILQITAPISPGSSGGPVLDQTGTVVGVSVASITNGQNLNFAIPSEHVVALQKSRTELRRFGAISRSQDRNTLLGHLGGEQPRTGIVGENFAWENGSEFSFSLHNKLANDVRNAYGFVIFYDPQGKPLDNWPINYRAAIPGYTAKRIRGTVDPSVRRLSESFWLWDNTSHAWRQFTGNFDEDAKLSKRSTKTETRKGKVEFRILDFSIGE
jgi:hypothetical protein